MGQHDVRTGRHLEPDLRLHQNLSLRLKTSNRFPQKGPATKGSEILYYPWSLALDAPFFADPFCGVGVHNAEYESAPRSH